MFYCFACGGLRDSDDGCEEAPASKYQLICAECADKAAEERGIDEQRAWYDTSEELK